MIRPFPQVTAALDSLGVKLPAKLRNEIFTKLATCEDDAFPATEILRLCGIEPFGDWLKRVSPELTWNWPWQVYLCRALDRVTLGITDRLCLSMPPRHGKSTMVTIRYPVYRMQIQAAFPVIVLSYSARLAEEFSLKSRKLAQAIGMVGGGREMVERWDTHNGGAYMCAGLGGGITGHGGKLVLIDDPVKSHEEAHSPTYRNRVWNAWTDDIRTRLEPGGAVIAIMTRWHWDDLIGRFLSADDGARWEVINLPAEADTHDPLGRAPGEALCPERFDEETLDAIKAGMPANRYAALYGGKPVAEGGAIYDRAWFEGDRNRYHIGSQLHRTTVARWVSMDTAFEQTETAAWTGTTVWELTTDWRLLLTHAHRAHMGFPELLQFTRRMIMRWNSDSKLNGVIIERKASGTSLIQSLLDQLPPEHQRLILSYTPEGSKIDRGRSASVWCANDSIMLSYAHKDCPWLYDYEQELFTFPASAASDWADSTSQAIDFTSHLLRRGLIERRRDARALAVA